MLADQLEGVAVPGGDEHVHAFGETPRGERGDDVVSLVSRDGQAGDPDQPKQFLEQAHLAGELRRGFGAARLVLGVLLMPERGLGAVPGHGDVRGLLFAEQLDQHRREAVDGIGGLACAVDEFFCRERVERAEGHGVAVHEEQPGAPTSFTGLGGTGLLGGRLCVHHTTNPRMRRRHLRGSRGGPALTFPFTVREQ